MPPALLASTLHPPRQQTLHFQGLVQNNLHQSCTAQHTRCFSCEIPSDTSRARVRVGHAGAQTASRDWLFNNQSLFRKMAVLEQAAEAQGRSLVLPPCSWQGQGLGAAGHGSVGRPEQPQVRREQGTGRAQLCLRSVSLAKASPGM